MKFQTVALLALVPVAQPFAPSAYNAVVRTPTRESYWIGRLAILDHC